MNKLNNFTTSLHTHVRSIFDAHMPQKDLVKRIKEMGGKGIVVTDHDVLTSIEDYKTAFIDAGLKFIPGLEGSVDGGILGRMHLVLIAKNDNGYKCISKISTNSNKNLHKGIPVITKEMLKETVKRYKGDVYALSACMQGVLCTVFLLNEKVEKEIEKLKAKQSKYYAPDSAQAEAASDVVKNCTYRYEETVLERDECKALAETKFTKRINAIKKLQAEGKDVEGLLKELEEDQLKAKKASEELEEKKQAVLDARSQLSNANKNLKQINESIENYNKYQTQIDELTKELKSEEELMELARKEALFYQDIFGVGNFYVELQYHGLKEEIKCYPKALKVAKELGLPIVATNDVHMINNTDDEVLKRCLLRSLRFGEAFEEATECDRELYLKNNEELFEALVKIIPKEDAIEAINNIDIIFDSCNVEFSVEPHYPKFSKDGDANKLLYKAIVENIPNRFPEGLTQEYKDRLNYEYKIITSMGYADYHLVVKDFLEYGRLLGYVPKDKLQDAPLTIKELEEYIDKNGWQNAGFTTGPGRGSAAGSLICYILGITKLDPIKYGLLFERFLNPERISMPDIDVDLSNTTRQKVIEYVMNKYGESAVCAIMTTNAQAPKGALNIAAKYYGLRKNGEPLTSIGRSLSKDVPNDVNTSFSTIVDENGTVSTQGKTLYEYMLNKYSSQKDICEIIRWAKVFEGSFTAYGAHAAGIVIADNNDISDYIPLRYNNDLGMFTSQCNKEQVEENGLLKFDFLGLRTLDVITDTLKMIEKNHGIIIDPLKLDLEDEAVYENILAVGKTSSVFQFESSGMKQMLKKFKPQSFEDLIILVSMFRPGPLQYLDSVIEVKHKRKEMTFLHPMLKPILEATYGAIVYQEQVMQICQQLAGYTLGGADMVRRYMSKKKEDKLEKEREKFVSGCLKNNISEEISNTLFDQMMDFAKYAFNKSHAAVYAYVAFITAWLKYYYPAEYFASALNWTTSKKLAGLMFEADSMGVKVLAPDVNYSQKDFSVVDGQIRFGLSAVAGVKNQADAIISYREEYGKFENFKEFITNINVDKTVVLNLASAGAFDCFGNNRKALKKYAEEIRPVITEIKKKKSFIKSAETVLPYVEKNSSEDIIKIQQDLGLKAEIKETTTVDKLEKRIETAKKSVAALNNELNSIRVSDVEEDKSERMALEKEYLGIWVTQHPLDFYPNNEEMECVNIDDLTPTDTIAYGIITNVVIKKTKKDGKEMAFFTLEDKSSSIDVCVFPKQYSVVKNMITDGNVIRIFGRVELEEVKNNSGNSDDEEIDVVKKMYLENCIDVKQKAASLVMTVSSYAVFHLNYEEEFLKKYKDDNGHPLYIYDTALNEFRKSIYKVSAEVKKFPNISQINI